MDENEALSELAAASRDDLGLLLTAASRTVNAAIARRVADAGHPIRLAHFPVFSGLEAGGTRISALAEHAGHSRQAMSALVKEVEAFGYVTTAPDPADRRATIVRLTERGVAFCRDVVAASRDLTHAYAERLGPDALDTLRDSLRALR